LAFTGFIFMVVILASKTNTKHIIGVLTNKFFIIVNSFPFLISIEADNKGFSLTSHSHQN
jgi:hypothetical protein